MPYLVDGYNLAGASTQWNRTSSQTADALIRSLNRFARLKRTSVTVVFDGFPSDGDRARTLFRSFDAVKIIYAGDQSDADTRIRNIIATIQNRRGWIVVSSDHAVHGYARVSGLKALRSPQFLREAQMLMERQTKEESKMDEAELSYWKNVFGSAKEED